MTRNKQLVHSHAHDEARYSGYESTHFNAKTRILPCFNLRKYFAWNCK